LLPFAALPVARDDADASRASLSLPSCRGTLAGFVTAREWLEVKAPGARHP
jgi:hypothetical protein